MRIYIIPVAMLLVVISFVPSGAKAQGFLGIINPLRCDTIDGCLMRIATFTSVIAQPILTITVLWA